ncbi:MAG TPA: dTDP-4-dehydrorhamnose reductase [Terracidiphilus sp.]|nr:dTDP-4-dehydrorhamnose reductase [Terracidiphilus sp.]
MSGTPRILLLGAGGQLGQALTESFQDVGELQAHTHASLDLAQPDVIRAAMRAANPTVILNAAAYTAVDRAESEPELARVINATAPGILAEEAARSAALLIHYSTDYVYDGTKSGPWTEDDPVAPLNTYGATKLAGEQAIAAAGADHLIFRTSWVFGPVGSNFVRTMLRIGRERTELNIVDDQLGAPTSTLELARATRAIVDGILANRFGEPSHYSGVYHMSCAGSVSWCGFARAIFERAATAHGFTAPAVHPIPTSAYPTPARRPHNSVMSNEKLRARFGVQLAPWQDALDKVLARLA